jgi:hypothetical protein
MKTTAIMNKKEGFMKSLVLIIVLVFLTACSIKAQPTVSGQQANRFYPDELIGHRLSLVSKTSVGEFSFVDKDHVIAIIGTVSGPVAGPVLEWQIDQQGRLVIDFSGFKQTWTKLSVHGDLIEIECSTGPIKPYRHEYIIQPRRTSAAARNYPKNSFSTAELAGSNLLFDTSLPDRKYTFNPDGTGTFSVDPQEGVQLSEDERAFRWSVDQKGMLQMSWPSGRVMVWRKLSRENDTIMAEFTEPPSPPTRATYRRSKQ